MKHIFIIIIGLFFCGCSITKATKTSHWLGGLDSIKVLPPFEITIGDVGDLIANKDSTYIKPIKHGIAFPPDYVITNLGNGLFVSDSWCDGCGVVSGRNLKHVIRKLKHGRKK